MNQNREQQLRRVLDYYSNKDGFLGSNNLAHKDLQKQTCQGTYPQKQVIAESEISYMKLMEYINMIAARCKNSFKNQQIQFLLEFNIRMRINFVQQQYGINSQQLCELKKRHSSPLLPPRVGQTDRLRLFSPASTEFKLQLQWQTQAQLKHIIRPLLFQLAQIDSQQKAARWEQQMRLTDFLLAAFVLNGNLIETDNHPSSLQDLRVILSSPHRLNLSTSRRIVQKGRKLKII